MAYFDVFNGDADGICSLQQLRLAEPRESALVTGVKRDIALLKRVQAESGDEVTVLDVSLDKTLIKVLQCRRGRLTLVVSSCWHRGQSFANRSLCFSVSLSKMSL